jgi:hypothetical protein
MKEIVVEVGSVSEGSVELRDWWIIGDRWGTESCNK